MEESLLQLHIARHIDIIKFFNRNRLPMKSIKRLQLAHNSAARLITLTSRFEHISPILKQLHWLPIHKRCQLKILVFVYKALHTSAPSYQCELLNWYQPPRPLRSASTTSLVPNKNKAVRYGRRLLDSSAATLWNILPPKLKCRMFQRTN